jgi:NADH-quinone oxidoreductase subunit E
LLKEAHSEEIIAILAKYPPEHSRSAVMPLLFLAQRTYGYLDRQAVEEVAGLLGLESTEVASLIGFYTLFHDRPGGTYRIQICTDLPCALRGAEGFATQVCASLGVGRGETTADGLLTVEEVKCLAACDRAPMFQLQAPDGIHYYEDQTIESVKALVAELRREKPNG